MNKEFAIIVVDKSKKVVGMVTDFQSLGFSINTKDVNQGSDNIDELLDWAKENNVTIYYMIGGVRIPFTRATYDREMYLRRVGWWNLTPAEAVIFSFLYQERYKKSGWVLTNRLEEMLTVFGFTPNCLRMLILKLRKKLSFTNFDVENKNKVGYRLVNPVEDRKNEFLMKENRAQSDYWILFADSKLHHINDDNVEQFMTGARLTGGQILRGWQGFTRTEAQIFFELVKHRGEWVTHEHLFTLPWAVKKRTEKKSMDRKLHNFVWKIRRKIANTDEEILTEYRKGYCLI